MEITTINTELVAKMFLAGAKNLDAKKEWITACIEEGLNIPEHDEQTFSWY